ncbi:hypothetical protein BDDG_03203 [Blastomyces dermatitidis ATCC 18188]|uniref:Uncharacterized protein n=1 Tax=Ajellomyces dermatitidis (strain ATCC 18188 / CBS 674.68) TaxID=653446 RepID=F2TAJ9_AJEDA|nr:hypothetical protein BDDG_03203 [Blastomyces dermatitidis ATCC 18188]
MELFLRGNIHNLDQPPVREVSEKGISPGSLLQATQRLPSRLGVISLSPRGFVLRSIISLPISKHSHLTVRMTMGCIG